MLLRQNLQWLLYIYRGVYLLNHLQHCKVNSNDVINVYMCIKNCIPLLWQERQKSNPTTRRSKMYFVLFLIIILSLWISNRDRELTLNMVLPSWAGDMLTTTPADWRAAIFSLAPPFPPAMMAPAWPILRPGGAVSPAMKDTTGFEFAPWIIKNKGKHDLKRRWRCAQWRITSKEWRREANRVCVGGGVCVSTNRENYFSAPALYSFIRN